MSIAEIGRTVADRGDHLTATVSVSPATRRATVTVTGELDLVSAERLTAVLDATLDAKPAALDIDLGGVEIIDSSGIRALVVARRRALSLGCPVAITAVQPFVRRVLTICGLLQALNVAP